MDDLRVVVYPLDGIAKGDVTLGKAKEILSNSEANGLISHIKINDGVHGDHGPGIMAELRKLIGDCGVPVGLFFDFKLADTNGTNGNVVKQYLPVFQSGDILTVRESCSIKSFRELRQILPSGVKIALVSMLTDTPVAECRRKYGMFPHVKIFNDITNLWAEWKESCGEEIASQPFDAVVCSPHELEFLKRNFPELEFIVPGIRDAWMDAGQQARFMGVAEALKFGANFLVIGSQISKGNPKEGVAAEESLRRTIEEVKKAKGLKSMRNPV
jgi:orotidine-5'-phosphate decarboxylase